MVRPDIRWSFVTSTVAKWVLPIWFISHASLIAFNYAIAWGDVGADAVVYLEAASRAVAGRDPWIGSAFGLSFAGPPPTLLPYMPLALLPSELAYVIAMVGGAAAGIWAVRRLRLPFWWICFPPVFEAIVVGNPDVVILALLLMSDRVAGISIVFKIYGAIPLLLQRRFRATVIGFGISLLSAPLWPTFLGHLPDISRTLDSQSAGFSAWGSWMIIPTLAALWSLRRLGASWLVVPGLWPDTQVHYSAMSLPAIYRFPLAAVIIGFASPFAAPLAIIVMAIQARWLPSSILPERGQ